MYMLSPHLRINVPWAVPKFILRPRNFLKEGIPTYIVFTSRMYKIARFAGKSLCIFCMFVLIVIDK